MKGRTIVKYLAALAMVIAMIGCGSDTDEDLEEPPSSGETAIGTVSMEILYPDAAGYDNITDASAELYENADTVLDALTAYGKASDLPVVVERGGAYTYVTGIGGIFEKDYGESTGWVFTVNDEMVMENAVDCVLSDGDKVTWEYVDYSDTDMQ